MKICLISPRVNFSTNIEALNEFWMQFEKNGHNKNMFSGISTALLTIAGLTPKEHQITFIDENYATINSLQKFDLVGISALTPNALRAYTIADKFRENNTKVILGGIHPTLLYEEAKQHADSVVIGEAEYIWRDLLDDFTKNTLKQFYKSDRVVNLTDSPIPRYDLLNANNYNYIWVQTSRGCPHDCEYCTSSKIYGKGYRRKSTEQILNELIYVKKIYPNKEIFFSDDNFLSGKESIYPLLEKMIDLKIKWSAQTDISVGSDLKFIKLIKKSGCSLLFIGLESITENGLKNLDRGNWKFRQLKHYSSYLHNIQSHGIGVTGAFMVGMDSDDISMFDNLQKFIIENYLFHSSITILTPAYGTRLRERLIKEERLFSDTWENYTGYNINFRPKKMTILELEVGLVNTYKKIFSKEVMLKKMEYFKKIQKNIILQEEQN